MEQKERDEQRLKDKIKREEAYKQRQEKELLKK
jgi:hypothetical protein